HFADGLASGRSPEELAAAFGDPARAAKLIRRAKRRNRGVIWQAWRRTRQGAGVLLALLLMLYGVQAVRFYSGHPQIKRNYTAELNAQILSYPPGERAWPIYLKASRAMGKVPDDLYAVNDTNPEDPLWPQKPGD